MAEKSDHVGRKFGFTKVLWEIKNYCVAAKRLEWTFYSPEFYVAGFRLTKWRMFISNFIKPEEEDAVLFQLERLECDQNVIEGWVDCVIGYHDHRGLYYEEEIKTSFKKNKIFKKLLRHAGIVPENTCHSNVFELTCEILIYFSDVPEIIAPCENIGIGRLSDDLHYIYENGMYHDLKFQLKNRTIYAHKCILYYRITDEEFKYDLTENGEVTINADIFTYESVDKVLRFLYSGYMRHAVLFPDISVFKFAKYLDVKPIISYFNPNIIKMSSVVGVEEFCATWRIEDFYNKEENFLSSPLMTNVTMDTKWCLKVYPKGYGRKGNDVGIVIDIETTLPKQICVEFYLKEGLERRISYVEHKKIVSKEVFGNRNFIELDNVKNYLMNGSLTINLNLRIATGGETVSIINETSTYECFSEQENYDRLSKDIRNLYDDKIFHDMPVKFNEHNITFNLHECFVLQRCSSLHHAFKTEDIAYFKDIKLSVIKEMFFYLYNGKLGDSIPLEDNFRLYQIAKHFNIITLKYVVTERLQNSLNELNSVLIYNFANSESIDYLCLLAESYVKKNALKE